MRTHSDAHSYVDLRRRLPEPPMRRAIRQTAGLSLRQVAGYVGVTASAVSYWEAGRRQPRPEHLQAYVELLEDLGRP